MIIILNEFNRRLDCVLGGGIGFLIIIAYQMVLRQIQNKRGKAIYQFGGRYFIGCGIFLAELIQPGYRIGAYGIGKMTVEFHCFKVKTEIPAKGAVQDQTVLNMG